MNTLSYIIQYENRIHPAASDYTYSTFADYTPAVVFSQLQVQRSNKHMMYNKFCLSSLPYDISD